MSQIAPEKLNFLHLYIKLQKIGSNKIPNIRIMRLSSKHIIFSWDSTKKKYQNER